ncbi:MAG TPA: Ig-like domain-containing protein, partial [Anaerolineales bacterium]|nr:Ig-like domain-containing protein [Anaerolineales bacterium]
MKTKSFTHRSLTVVLTTILLLVAIPVASAFAATSGPNYPGTAATSGGTGDAWAASSGTLVSALGADDDVTASVTLTTAASQNLDMTNFGFSIPTDATINGISVEMNRWASAGNVSDDTVQLFKAGSLVGEDKAADGNWDTVTSTVVTYGGASDLWGTTWTPAEINASDFGVTLDLKRGGSNPRTANVDYVRITVTYTPANAATTTTVTSSVNPSTYGDSVTFTATVTSTSTPTGSVNFVIDGGAPVAGTAGATTATTATWTYTTSALNAGSHTVQADYTATGLFSNSSGTLSGGQTVNKANPNCSSITGYSVTYDGNSHTATGSCQGVGGDGTLAGLDLSATTHTAVGTYNDDPWSFTDVSGNYNDASGTVDSVISNVPDTTAPVVSSVVRASANPNGSASVDFTVTFSEAVTGVDTTDFSLATSGIAGASVAGVSGSGSVYTVSVNTGFGNGKIRLDVQDNDSIVDAASNPLDGAFTTGETYTILKGGDTTGVFRPSNGVIFLKNSNTTGFADVALNYGIPNDQPVVGDWDGNGTDTIGVYRNGKFYLRNSNTIGFADIEFAFGQAGDQPIAGDWDGDGIDTIGIFRPSTGLFMLRNSNSAGSFDVQFFLGNVGDVGIAGDWDGDGMDTTGVFRPVNGMIFLKNTNVSGFADVELNYGIPGDK